MTQIHRTEQLPGKVLNELNSRLAESGFGNFVELSAWLKSEGYNISKSSIHRYAQRLRKAKEAQTETAGDTEAGFRMRCAEVSGSFYKDGDLIGHSSDLFFWVTTGRRP